MFIVNNNQIFQIEDQKREIVIKKLLKISQEYCTSKNLKFSQEDVEIMVNYCFKCGMKSMFNIFLFLKLFFDYNSDILLHPSKEVEQAMNWPDRSEEDKLKFLFRMLSHD